MLKSIAVSLLFVFTGSAFAQTGCSQFNYPLGPYITGHNDSSRHVSGVHSSAFSATAKCTYVGQAGQACIPSALAQEINPSYADTGALMDLGWHVGKSDDADGAASGAAGQSVSASTIGAVAFEHCLIPGCAFQITLTGSGAAGYSASFPPGTVWHDQFPYTVTCTGHTAPPAGTGCSPNCGPSPIIVDTTGKVGYLHGMSDPKNACILFDINGDGKPLCISWPLPGSGLKWLVLPDENGNVTSVKQMFGSKTPQIHHINPDDPKNGNGFLAAAEWDMYAVGGNLDLMLSKKDQVWTGVKGNEKRRLKLWEDKHCYLTPGIPCTAHKDELTPLEADKIENISLVYNESSLIDEWGNQFKFYSHINVKPEKLQDADTDQRVIYDVYVTVNQ